MQYILPIFRFARASRHRRHPPPFPFDIDASSLSFCRGPALALGGRLAASNALWLTLAARVCGLMGFVRARALENPCTVRARSQRRSVMPFVCVCVGAAGRCGEVVRARVL